MGYQGKLLDWLDLIFLFLPRIQSFLFLHRIRQTSKLTEEYSSARSQDLSHLSLFSRCQKNLEIKSECWIMGF